MLSFAGRMRVYREDNQVFKSIHYSLLRRFQISVFRESVESNRIRKQSTVLLKWPTLSKGSLMARHTSPWEKYSSVTFHQPFLAGCILTTLHQCNDGREIALLHWIFNHPKLEEMRGQPQRVLDAIDEYGKAEKYLMNVGEYKSKTVIDIIHNVKPVTMVELGGYVGYSAIAFGAAARAVGGRRYYSLEQNPEYGAIATLLVDLAGLGDFVKIIVESSVDALRRLHGNGTLEHIDLLFIDHTKPLYTPDLKVAEELGLVKPGSVCVADNGEKPEFASVLQCILTCLSRHAGQSRLPRVRSKYSRAKERTL
jgi:predicted O-methyltransferase YrrM